MARSSLKCSVCGENKSRPQYIIVMFRGRKIRVLKPGGICKACFTNEIIAKIKKFETDGYFKINAGLVHVNWPRCIKAYALQDEFYGEWESLVLALVNLQVLSYLTSGNYMIMREGSQYCLHNCGNSLYFTDRDNADGFAAAFAARYNGNMTVVKFSSD